MCYYDMFFKELWWTTDACIFNCQLQCESWRKRPLDRGWAKLSRAALSLHLFPLWRPPSLRLFVSLVFVWVVLADLHWDTAMTLIAVICQWAPVVAGEHSDITPKHCGGGAVRISLSSRWWVRAELLKKKRQSNAHTQNTLPIPDFLWSNMTLRQYLTLCVCVCVAVSPSTIQQIAEKHVEPVTWPISF